MKSIAMIPLVIVLLQLISSEASPAPLTDTGKPTTKDVLFNFFPPKAEEFYKANLLEKGSLRIKLSQSYLAFLESQKENGDPKYDTQTYQDLKKAQLDLAESLEKIKKNKVTCALAKDVEEKLAGVQSFLQFDALDDKLKAILLKIYREAPGDRSAIALYNEINDKLPQVIEEFVQSLEGAEKENYEDQLERDQIKYNVFYYYYKEKLGITDSDDEDIEDCENFEKKVITNFMEMLIGIWSSNYQKARKEKQL